AHGTKLHHRHVRCGGKEVRLHRKILRDSSGHLTERPGATPESFIGIVHSLKPASTFHFEAGHSPLEQAAPREGLTANENSPGFFFAGAVLLKGDGAGFDLCRTRIKLYNTSL